MAIYKINENIRITRGNKGKNTTTQAKWDDFKVCPICGGKMYYTMTISDGGKGRGRITVTDEQGIEKSAETQTIALYYCPKCMKYIAESNMA